jgi:hypothetical protein
MILVKKDAEWPVVWEQHPSAFKMPTEKPLAAVVADGVIDWMRQAGEQPTDVIFGRRACQMLREEFQQFHEAVNIKLALPDDNFENTYHGLTFHRDKEMEGVILLTRGPAYKVQTQPHDA